MLGTKLNHFTMIDSGEMWLQFHPGDYEENLDQSSSNYYDYDVYINRIILDAFISIMSEYLDNKEEIKILPNDTEYSQLWSLINGTRLQIGKTTFVIIPIDTNDTDECCIQQEWIDINDWMADYYVFMQINLDNSWVRILGFINQNLLKEKAYFNQIDRTYELETEELFTDINLMWLSLLTSEKQMSKKTAKNLSMSSIDIFSKMPDGKSLFCSPRLNFNFSEWRDIITNDHSREILLKYVLKKPINDFLLIDIPGLGTEFINNLSNWFNKRQKEQQEIWLSIKNVLGFEKRNFAYGFRGYGMRKINPEIPSAIDGLIKLLQTESDAEIKLKAAECLGKISPNNLHAIESLIDILKNSNNKWLKCEAIASLGEIAIGNETAILALIKVLEGNEDEQVKWQAALSLGEIDPENKQAGIGKVRLIELGVEIDKIPLALLVAIRTIESEKIKIFVQVHPTKNQIFLPENLQLIILDENGVEFDQVEAKEHDNSIQLQINCEQSDRFSVKLQLGDNIYVEHFCI